MEQRSSEVEGMVMPGAAFWAGKRVLLTGHTGFKGSWTALWLEMLGAEVFGLALDPPPEADREPLWTAIGSPGVGLIGDICDAEIVARAFDRCKPEIVIHMAAQALVHPSYEDPVETFRTNVMGLITVLEASRRTPTIRAIVNVTSDKCYENIEQLWAYRETEPMGGSDPYSASKGCSELVTASYRRSFFKSSEACLASARAGNVIGGGDWSRDRLIPDCVRAFATNRPVMIRNPLSTRPWQHVLEPIAGYLTLAQSLFEHGSAFAEGWNFGPSDEDAWSVGKVVETVTGYWGGDARWAQDEAGYPHEAMLLRVDASKARQRLGWRPRLPIAQGLDWSVRWYLDVMSGADAREVTRSQIRAYGNFTGASE